MAMYTPLASPTEEKAHLQEIITNWARPIQRKLTRSDTLTNKRKEVEASSHTEYVLTADVAFFVKGQRNGQAVELIVPACAELTVFVPPEKWKPEKVIEAQQEAAREAQKKRRPVFRTSDAARTRVCFFKYTADAHDRIVTIFDDGSLQLKSIPVVGLRVS